MAFHKAVSSRYQKETSEIKRCITRRRQLCDLVKEAEKVCVKKRREAKERKNRRDRRKQWLKKARKKTVTQIPNPTTPRQVKEFLGTSGFYRL